MKSIRQPTRIHPLTRILWERLFHSEIKFDEFASRDGLRRFDEPRRESLRDSLRHISSTPCKTYSEDRHCGVCYFGYLFDLPDETHYNCMFDETFHIVYLSAHDEETQKIKHKIAKRVLKKRRKGSSTLELLKDEIFGWCRNYLDIHREGHRPYLDELRTKFGVKNVR